MSKNGMSPGNEESAGKRIRRRTRKGNPWLRSALTEAAWAAGRTKLGAVASDIMGKSGRAMLEALVAGERDPAQLAELAKKSGPRS